MWNAVELDGVRCHMDVTWDDPQPDRYGWAQHTHFLLSDSEMTKRHFAADDWLSGEDLQETGADYDNYFWKQNVSPFCYAEGGWYYITGF